MYPQHFHVCAHVVISSVLHVPATRPRYMSLQCALHKFFLSLKHVAATCPCNMTPRVSEPLSYFRNYLLLDIRTFSTGVEKRSGEMFTRWLISSLTTDYSSIEFSPNKVLFDEGLA